MDDSRKESVAGKATSGMDNAMNPFAA